MRMSLCFGAALAAVLLVPAGEIRAGMELLEFEIQVLDTAHRCASGDPADRVAVPKAAPLPLQANPFPGTGRVPAGEVRHYGLVAGTKVILVQQCGGKVVLAWDPDGDGNLGGPNAEIVQEGRAGKSEGRPVQRYRFQGVSLGAGTAEIKFEVIAPEPQAILVDAAVSPDPIPIALGCDAPKGATAVDPTTGRAVYGQVDGINVAFVRGAADRLYVIVDRNRNGTFGDRGELVPAPVAGRDGDATYWQVDGVKVGARTVTFAFQEIAGTTKATLKPQTALRGKASRDGVVLHLHLLDLDLDGRYDGSGDRWWLGPVEHLRQVKKLAPDAMVEGDEPCFINGEAWSITAGGSRGGVSLHRDVRPGKTIHDYMHRRAERVNRERWWPAFDAEADAFRREHGIDPRRPTTATPAHWVHDVDLTAALAAGKKHQKPILVDFEADWCSWCKRFDYYVYGDREVAELLSKFLLVKINKEFHFNGEFDRLGGKGLPFLIVLDQDGKPLRFPVTDAHGATTVASGPAGFQTPTAFAKTLRAALKAAGR